MTWSSCQHVVTIVIPRAMGLELLAGLDAATDACLEAIGVAVADAAAQSLDTASIAVEWDTTADGAEHIFAIADAIAPSDLDLFDVEEDAVDAAHEALEALRDTPDAIRELVTIVTAQARKEAA